MHRLVPIPLLNVWYSLKVACQLHALLVTKHVATIHDDDMPFTPDVNQRPSRRTRTHRAKEAEITMLCYRSPITRSNDDAFPIVFSGLLRLGLDFSSYFRISVHVCKHSTRHRLAIIDFLNLTSPRHRPCHNRVKTLRRWTLSRTRSDTRFSSIPSHGNIPRYL